MLQLRKKYTRIDELTRPIFAVKRGSLLLPPTPPSQPYTSAAHLVVTTYPRSTHSAIVDVIIEISRVDERSIYPLYSYINKPYVFLTEFHTFLLANFKSDVCGRPDLAVAASACVVRQSGTNFHRICEAQTPGNSLSVAFKLWLFACAYGRRCV